MTVCLPDFRDELLYELSACACACREDNKGVGWPEKGDTYLESGYSGHDHPAWIRLILDANDGEHCHFHVEVSREKFDASSWFKSTSEGELVAAIEKLRGLTLDATLIAKYRVPMDSIPRRGIMRSLLGVSTQACGAEMFLSGATMDVESDLFRRITWQLSDTDRDQVNVKVEAQSASTVGDDYLTRFVEVMRDGLDCFVFESTKEKTDNADDARSLPQKNVGTG